MSRDPRPTPQTLAAMDLFGALSPSALEAVAAAARMRRLPRNGLVFNQGDGDVCAHAVVEGAVRVAQSGSDGAQVVVRFVGPGEMFGAVAMFTDGRYPADAIAIVETLEVSWREAELLDLIHRYPRIAINVIRVIGKRLQEAQDRMRELATQSAERRIAHTLLRLMRQAGQGSVDGMTIAFPLRRKDVADIAGTTLHTVSRILTHWERGGLLTSRNQILTVLAPDEIERLAEDTAG